MDSQVTGVRPSGGTSLTTRRGFVAAASLGAVSLYGLWVGLGAAPLRIWDLRDADAGMDMGGGHEGHGAGGGPSPEEFRRMAEEHNGRYLQADGSVAIAPAPAAQGMADMDMSTGSDHSGHSMPAPGEAAHPNDTMPLDAYLVAQQWLFEPAVLRLKPNQPYRLRMMAVDVAHGASIQLGRAGHIIRLPRGVLVERQLTITQPGDYLLYCTMYCGEGHQYMSGKIVVA
ncbi:MAG: hypothetical protein KDK89_05015 [Alphaproteobacteria bacterium]|nr:hypothetical protein [Alphaproteobacteria bacterium]